VIPALIGFGLGWLARGLWDRRRAAAEEPLAAPTRVEPEVPPAAAFAQGPVTPDGDGE
jgi:hypothetical protein